MKHILAKPIKLSLMLFLLIGTSFTSKANIFKLTIKEELTNCVGVAPRTCYLVKYSNSTNWENFYSEIAGFKYEAGFRYVLKVKRTKRKNIPADANAYTYKLIKIIKKTKMESEQHTALKFLAKHKWKLIQLNGKTIENLSAFIIFDTKTNRISGNAGCNNVFGGFKISKTTIEFEQLGLTRMACDETKSRLETEFTKALTASNLTYDIADQTLNIYRSNQLIMMFGMAPL